MKTYVALIPLLSSVLSLTTLTSDNFEIVLKSKWRDLDQNSKTTIDFGGKWVLVGAITFKKRCKEPLSLENLSLSWNGEPLDNVIASLYKKNLSKDFLPIEENLICDGTWNKSKQSLIFNFDEKETLNPITTFYLVLTIPESIEPILKKGSFSLNEQSLPKPFKNCTSIEHLSLAINEPSTNQEQTQKI